MGAPFRHRPPLGLAIVTAAPLVAVTLVSQVARAEAPTPPEPALAVAPVTPAAFAVPTVGSAGLFAGEAATYKFSVGSIESGRARLAVGREMSRAGRRVMAIRGQAETSPWLRALVQLDDEYQLLLDAHTLFPLEVSSIERGVRSRRVDGKFDGRVADVTVVSGPPSRGVGRRLLPSAPRDPMSQFFWLRSAPLKDGERYQQLILDGTSLWRATLTVHRGERVRLGGQEAGAAPRPAIRVDGELERVTDAGAPMPRPRRHLSAWLSDDRLRVLLRAEADTDLGRCSLELTSYQPPSNAQQPAQRR